DVVDPHQAGRVAALGLVEGHLRRVAGGVVARGGRIAEDGFQRALGLVQDVVDGVLQAWGGHGVLDGRIADGGAGRTRAFSPPPPPPASARRAGKGAPCGGGARPVSFRLLRSTFCKTRGKVPPPAASESARPVNPMSST